MKKYVLSSFIVVFMFLLISMTMSMVDNSLVLYFTFDADKKTDIEDLSSYHNDGIIKGAPQQVEGKLGFALELNGVGDSIEIPHADNLNITTAVTMEMWVKLASDAGNVNQAGIEKGGWETGEYSLYVFYVPGNGSAVQFKDLPEACADANSGHLGANIMDDNWHHIAGTWDGKTISLYTDGKLDVSVECTGGSLGKNEKSVYIGSRTGSERFLKGVVDEVRIYDRALSEDEVKNDMETLGGFSVSPLNKLATSWGKIKN